MVGSQVARPAGTSRPPVGPGVAEPRAARQAAAPVVQGPGELERLQVIRPLDPGFGSALWQGWPARAGTAGTSSDSRQRGFTPKSTGVPFNRSGSTVQMASG